MSSLLTLIILLFPRKVKTIAEIQIDIWLIVIDHGMGILDFRFRRFINL